MIVFVEYVLIDNFIIDFIILYSVCKLLKISISRLRLVGASLLGVGFAFATPYLVLNNAILFIIKLLMGVILVYVGLPIKKIKQFILAYLAFLFLTFLLGGICYGLQGFVSSAKINNGAIEYTADFPVSLIIFAVFIFILLGNNLLQAMKSSKQNIKLDINFLGKTIRFYALVDSGNQLIDKKTKLPITFLSRKKFETAYENFNLKGASSYEYIMCKTVAGNKFLDTITIDKMIIDNKITLKNVRIALYDFDKTQSFNAILSANLIN